MDKNIDNLYYYESYVYDLKEKTNYESKLEKEIYYIIMNKIVQWKLAMNYKKESVF